MDDLTESVRQAMLPERLIRRGDRVVVGVSGGPDSMALLHVLASLKEAWRLRLGVVHVDHQLRPDSASDARFVEQAAHGLGLPVTVITRDVETETRQRGLSLEDGARRIRYEAFLEVARGQGAERLALAHTADDQAETVMMRLLRGSGLTGLSAIPMARALEEVTVIRPLLGVWRREVLAYLKAHRIESRQDPSNQDLRFLRNRIRHHLLPFLERDYNPNIRALLHQLAQQCRIDAAFLHGAAQRHWKRLVKSTAGELTIRLDGFLKQPTALQRQLMRLVIQQIQGDLTRFEFRHWVEIERLLTERPIGTLLDLPGGIQLKRDRERVVVSRSLASGTERPSRVEAPRPRADGTPQEALTAV